LGKRVSTVEEVERIIDRVPKINFYVTDEIFADYDMRRDVFNELTKIVNRSKRFTFVIDELASVTLKPGSRVASCPAQLQITVRRREKPPWYIGVYVTAQRLKDCDVDLLSQVDHLLMWDMYPMDVDYIEEKLGIEIRSRVESLEKYQYVYYCHEDKSVSVGKLEL